jgi:diacylglycerol kinase (ATP)
MFADCGRCDNASGTCHFMNVAGCGFDAHVAERINQGFRLVRGTAAYLAAVIQSLCQYKSCHLRITLDDEEIEDRVMLCAIANAQSYGGGMRVAPNASISDGLLDLIIVREISKMGFLRAFPSVFKGTHLSHPAVSSQTGKLVKLESENPMPILIDGELFGTTPATFQVMPGTVRIFVPASNPEA